MAKEHGMIEPFLPELVRESNGTKIISAGASSYGYDMRLAGEGIDTYPLDDHYSLIAHRIQAEDERTKS